MNEESLRLLLEQVRQGGATVDDAVRQLRIGPVEQLGYAMVDHQRALRQGAQEVIYCAGKTSEQVCGIASSMMMRGAENILLTRVRAEQVEALRPMDPSLQYHEMARIVVLRPCAHTVQEGTILVVTAGTSDMPIAEEAAITAETLGNRVDRLYDAGVAGIHRLLTQASRLMEANVLIVVAGMEGALASVVAGLVDRPVIAVPTSVGYGANFGGLSALLTMLNSCASGVGTVNIDNGFGAGFLASQINATARRSTRRGDV